LELYYNKLIDGAVMVGAETISFGIRPTLLAIIKQIGVLLYHISNKKTKRSMRATLLTDYSKSIIGGLNDGLFHQ